MLLDWLRRWSDWLFNDLRLLAFRFSLIKYLWVGDSWRMSVRRYVCSSSISCPELSEWIPRLSPAKWFLSALPSWWAWTQPHGFGGPSETPAWVLFWGLTRRVWKLQFDPFLCVFSDRPTHMWILWVWRGTSPCVTACTLCLRCGQALFLKQRGEPCLSGVRGTRRPASGAVLLRSVKILRYSCSRPHRRPSSCWAPLQHSDICWSGRGTPMLLTTFSQQRAPQARRRRAMSPLCTCVTLTPITISTTSPTGIRATSMQTAAKVESSPTRTSTACGVAASSAWVPAACHSRWVPAAAAAPGTVTPTPFCTHTATARPRCPCRVTPAREEEEEEEVIVGLHF